MKTILLLKYNKVTNDAFRHFSKHCRDFKEADLTKFGTSMDVLSFPEVSSLLKSCLPFDCVMVGDVFWPTGQNICRWCREKGKQSYFLQHGQWVYVKNKQNPDHLPFATFVYGTNVLKMTSKWAYSVRSKVLVSGNPRYDNIIPNTNGSYVYFCPPVILERIPSKADQFHSANYAWLDTLQGMDKKAKLLIHPHYREGQTVTLKNMFPKATFANPMDDPLPLIQGAEKVLTHRNSTTVIDAIACGKISILLNYPEHDTSFYRRGYFKEFAIETDSPQHCIDTLLSEKRLSISDNYIEKAKPYIYLGDASMRIKNIIGV